MNSSRIWTKQFFGKKTVNIISLKMTGILQDILWLHLGMQFKVLSGNTFGNSINNLLGGN